MLKMILKLIGILVAVVFCICFIIVLLVSLPWILLAIGLFFSEAPPKPSVTYEEFPFHLEYMLDDELVVVDDVIICEYTGIEMNEGIGKYRTWEKYIEGTGEDDHFITEVDGYKLYFNLGSANEYMGDIEITEA